MDPTPRRGWLNSPRGHTFRRAWTAQKPSEGVLLKRLEGASAFGRYRFGKIFGKVPFLGRGVVPRCANLCNEPDFKLYDFRFRPIAFHLDPRYLHDFRCVHCNAVVPFQVLCHHVFHKQRQKETPTILILYADYGVRFLSMHWWPGIGLLLSAGLLEQFKGSFSTESM